MNQHDREICCCEETATSHCAKCARGYCCRKCQLNDWKIHRGQCGKIVSAREISSLLVKKMAGNIAIMREKYGSDIRVEFPYDIVDFVESDVRIAYIRGDIVNDITENNPSDHTRSLHTKEHPDADSSGECSNQRKHVQVYFSDCDFSVVVQHTSVDTSVDTINPPLIWTIVL